jgi:uncharacterized SAM-binding protein YcdF (DUF218 family)
MVASKSQVKSISVYLATLILGLGLGVFGVAYFAAGTVYDYTDSQELKASPQIDAIVCLAGGRGRIRAAGDLWYEYYRRSPERPPVLYVSGMGRDSTLNVLSQHIQESIYKVMKPSDIVMENGSTNTRENAEWLRAHLSPRKWNRFVLVTSTYHMKRARFIFEKVLDGLNVEMRTYSHIQSPYTHKEWKTSILGIQVTVEEYLKGLYYQAVL